MEDLRDCKSPNGSVHAADSGAEGRNIEAPANIVDFVLNESSSTRASNDLSYIESAHTRIAEIASIASALQGPAARSLRRRAEASRPAQRSQRRQDGASRASMEDWQNCQLVWSNPRHRLAEREVREPLHRSPISFLEEISSSEDGNDVQDDLRDCVRVWRNAHARAASPSSCIGRIAEREDRMPRTRIDATRIEATGIEAADSMPEWWKALLALRTLEASAQRPSQETQEGSPEGAPSASAPRMTPTLPSGAPSGGVRPLHGRRLAVYR